MATCSACGCQFVVLVIVLAPRGHGGVATSHCAQDLAGADNSSAEALQAKS